MYSLLTVHLESLDSRRLDNFRVAYSRCSTVSLTVGRKWVRRHTFAYCLNRKRTMMCDEPRAPDWLETTVAAVSTILRLRQGWVESETKCIPEIRYAWKWKAIIYVYLVCFQILVNFFIEEINSCWFVFWIGVCGEPFCLNLKHHRKWATKDRETFWNNKGHLRSPRAKKGQPVGIRDCAFVCFSARNSSVMCISKGRLVDYVYLLQCSIAMPHGQLNTF